MTESPTFDRGKLEKYLQQVVLVQSVIFPGRVPKAEAKFLVYIGEGNNPIVSFQGVMRYLSSIARITGADKQIVYEDPKKLELWDRYLAEYLAKGGLQEQYADGLKGLTKLYGLDQF